MHIKKERNLVNRDWMRENDVYEIHHTLHTTDKGQGIQDKIMATIALLNLRKYGAAGVHMNHHCHL